MTRFLALAGGGVCQGAETRSSLGTRTPGTPHGFSRCRLNGLKDLTRLGELELGTTD